MEASASRYRRQRGHETETAVARYLAEHGWPFAEPVGAGRPGSDVTGIPGLAIEVKAQKMLRLVAWLKQAGSHATRGELAAVVLRPDRMGPASVGAWPVVMRFDEWTRLLHVAGYGEAEPELDAGEAARLAALPVIGMMAADHIIRSSKGGDDGGADGAVVGHAG